MGKPEAMPGTVLACCPWAVSCKSEVVFPKSCVGEVRVRSDVVQVSFLGSLCHLAGLATLVWLVLGVFWTQVALVVISVIVCAYMQSYSHFQIFGFSGLWLPWDLGNPTAVLSSQNAAE